MLVVLLAVGKLRPALREVADDYTRRLGRYATIREIEVKEASRAPTPSAQRAEEARRLEDRAPAGSAVVALARSGRPWSSEELARALGRWRDAARSVAFAIGGSHGLDDGLLQGATERWSLGPLTLPHELARVVVLEQIYRGFTILAGAQYHKGR